MYKGIVKVTYDRGYALQTKSLLLENTSTAFEAVKQLFEALGLRGSPKDYALEERNIVTGGEKWEMFLPLFLFVVVVVTGGNISSLLLLFLLLLLKLYLVFMHVARLLFASIVFYPMQQGPSMCRVCTFDSQNETKQEFIECILRAD